MSSAGTPSSPRILAVRLGAMGDIIHTLPAVAALKRGHPGSHVTWVVEPQWAPLLEGNPFVDRVLLLRRDSGAGLLRTAGASCVPGQYHLAVDFQGLLKSAVVAAAARPERIFGFHQSQLRERAAALFYSDKIFELRPSTWWTAIAIWPRPPPGACQPPAARLPAAARPPGGRLARGRLRAGLAAGRLAFQAVAGGALSRARRLLRELGIPLVLNGREAAAPAGRGRRRPALFRPGRLDLRHAPRRRRAGRG